MLVKGICVTTHIDKHNCRIAKETLKNVVKDINERMCAIGVGIEYKSTIMPISKVISGQMVKLKGREYEIEMEYSISIGNRMREDVDSMCNLSQGILEKGEAKIILAMYKNGYTVEQIASATDKDIEEIKAIVEKGRIV